MIDKLDSKNIELTKILFDLKQSLDLYKLIALNSNSINSVPGKAFFGHTQRLAIKSFVIDICKIYEERKKNKLNSIPSIIDFIQGSKVKPQHPEMVEKYIKEHNVKTYKKYFYGAPLRCILENFKNGNKKSLKRFKDFRDSKVAHTEDSSRKDVQELPSYAVMEKLLFFAIDFYSLINEAYVGIGPIPHKTDSRVFTSLHTILKQLGHTSMKIDFED